MKTARISPALLAMVLVLQVGAPARPPHHVQFAVAALGPPLANKSADGGRLGARFFDDNGW